MPANDLDLLIDAARAAGEIATEHWRSDPKVWEKDGAGPVSEADLAVDEMLKDRLGAARPDYGWLSEETADDTVRMDASRTFIVDPIDGTRAYVAGERTWAHAIAVAEHGQVTAGVVYLPLRNKLYAAAVGRGAHLNGTPIRCSDREELTGASILAQKVTFDRSNWRRVPKIDRHFRPALAYRLCLVAEGRFDATITLRPTWEWDIAAGTIIASEAGARVSDRTGAPISFNSQGRLSPGCVVGPGPLSAAILRDLA